MNRQWVLLVVVTLAVTLALGSLAVVQAGKDQGGRYAVEITDAAGGRYVLDNGGWQVQGSASGGGYHLLAVTGPAGGGTPCCCSYVPCILRNH